MGTGKNRFMILTTIVLGGLLWLPPVPAGKIAPVHAQRLVQRAVWRGMAWHPWPYYFTEILA
jgi:hypothetical protein